MKFHAQLAHKHPQLAARVMKVMTPHGEFETPHFMPVGTRAFVNHLTPQDLRDTGSHIILGGNTYHMLCAPGIEVLQKLGGMHPFMNWTGPLLTDSGGFQVFSLSKNKKICQIDEEGAHFKHPITQQVLHLNAETSLQAQKIIGADIIMAFDQCTPDTEDKNLAQQAMERTHRWLTRSLTYHAQHPNSAYRYPQALFGIIQGAFFKDLRMASAEFIVSADCDGIAIGGESIGFDMKKTVDIIDWVRPILPPAKLRYTMGVGLSPQDLIEVVARGIDIFDCVAPTRNARHGSLYHGTWIEGNQWLRFEPGVENGRLLIKKAIYAHDEQPILENCRCHTCQHYSRGYLHYLFKNKLPAFNQLASIHNIFMMQETCRRMREVIKRH